MVNALPNEVFLLIAENLPTDRDVSALMRTNHALYDLLVTYLYKRNMRSKFPALFWCCRNGLLTPVKRMLSLKADVNSHRCLYHGEATPLMGAAREGYVGMTKLLLEHGAEVDLCNPDGGPCEPPLTLAAAEDKDDFLCHPKEIQNYWSSDDESLDERLYQDNVFDVRVAEKSEDTRDYQAVVKLLLDHGANPNNTKNGSHSWVSPLMVAARCGNLETAKILLAHGASPSLHYSAYESGYGSRIQEWESPLKMACYLESPGREPMLDLLLQHGADINLENEAGETMLFAFIDGRLDDSVDLIRELCKRGAVANYLDLNHDTPLHLCQSSEDMVKVLLEYGGDVDAANLIGHTPLFYHDKVPALKQLLAHGADPNIEDYIGYRPLTKLVSSGNYDAVKFLIDHGADPNYELPYGRTNLHTAAMNGHAVIVKLLLEHGAYLGTVADDGSTAWDLAKDKECREMLARWARRENQENHLSARKDPDAVDEISDGSDYSPGY
ncbi:hypothetical protein PITC_077300 [Penicillium italicum]|uniref:Uncharacterized protein n=1 Tax=Penicillium italicum TaxID=40296 RepID=A0A0A2KPS9_PENIT|nr:hypothetical protein PITC_077300 [Penicillium italicum]